MDECSLRSKFCTVRLNWAREIWAIEMNFGMNHAIGAGSITQHVDLQSKALSLCYSCTLPYATDVKDKNEA